MEHERMLIRTFLSLFASLAVGLIGFSLTLFIALFLVPAKDNFGHGNMALGQAFIAFIVAIALGVWSLYVLLRKYAKLLPFKK